MLETYTHGCPSEGAIYMLINLRRYRYTQFTTISRRSTPGAITVLYRCTLQGGVEDCDVDSLDVV